MADDQRFKIRNPGNMPYQPKQIKKQWANVGAFSEYKCSKVRVDRNIVLRNGRFSVRIWDGKRQVTFGTYDTEEEARKVRDAEEARMVVKRRQNKCASDT